MVSEAILQPLSRSHLYRQGRVLCGFSNTIHFSGKRTLTVNTLPIYRAAIPYILIQVITGDHKWQHELQQLHQPADFSRTPTIACLQYQTGTFFHPLTTISTRGESNTFTLMPFQRAFLFAYLAWTYRAQLLKKKKTTEHTHTRCDHTTTCDPTASGRTFHAKKHDLEYLNDSYQAF